MALWKRGKWFWADFSVNGVRYRVPLKDTKCRRISADDDHREIAARAEEREITKAERGEIAPQRRSTGRLPFGKAADEYLASRKMELARRPREGNRPRPPRSNSTLDSGALSAVRRKHTRLP